MSNQRFDFLGVQITATNPTEAVKQVSSYSFTAPGYICFPDASVIKEANADPLLKSILNNAYLTMPDGKPSQVVGRLRGNKSVSTVSGFHLCKALLKTNATHYFYGGTDELLIDLKKNLQQQFPQANILGFKSPPFIPASAIEKSEQISQDITEINKLQPDYVWIGISSPKQDYLMHHHHQSFDRSLMLGVGGVFLYLADETLKSPEWVKKMGLRWAYRLLKEPKRLWPKYYATFSFLFRNSSYFFRLLISPKTT